MTWYGRYLTLGRTGLGMGSEAGEGFISGRDGWGRVGWGFCVCALPGLCEQVFEF